MRVVGLTGGICTGKSAVLAIFRELGCYTLRADELAKGIIFDESSSIGPQILAVFGQDVFDKDGSLNKEKFSQTLFADPEKRAFVNSLVHPLVAKARKEKVKQIAATSHYEFFIYESALLVESGAYRELEKLVVVYCSAEEQLRRLMERDAIDQAEAEKKIHAQFPFKEKLRVSDYAIDTSGSSQNTRTNTLEVFHLLTKDFHSF